MAEFCFIVRKYDNKQEVGRKWLHFVDMMTICLNTPYVVNITSILCAPEKKDLPYIGIFLGKIRISREWLARSAILFGILILIKYRAHTVILECAAFLIVSSGEFYSCGAVDHRAKNPPWQTLVRQEQSRSPAVILTRSSPQKCSGTKFPKKQGHCNNQTQEYASINITQGVHCEPAAADWQPARCLACRAGWRLGPFTGFPVYTLHDMCLAQWSGKCLHVAK